jgi:putative intracellular protease/amidase
MTIPYYEFLDAGMTVDVASIKGGKIPIESMSLKWPIAAPADKRFLKDKVYLSKVNNSLKIDDVDFTQYDIIYMAGGWGAAYDLGQSDVLGKKISDAYAKNKILGSVCHGALGFIKAVDKKILLKSPLLSKLLFII